MQTTRQTLNVGGIWVLPLTGERIPRPFVQSPGAAYDGQFSPNGRWAPRKNLAERRVTSCRSTLSRCWILGTGLWTPVVAANGRSPQEEATSRWRGDGKEIFCLTPDNQMTAVQVEERGNSIEVQMAQPLFQTVVARAVAPLWRESGRERIRG